MNTLKQMTNDECRMEFQRPFCHSSFVIRHLIRVHPWLKDTISINHQLTTIN